MQDTITLISPDKKSTVIVYKGELVSYIFKGVELMHQKGTPGWGSTETEMFPIIGPTNEVGFSVKTPKGDAKQDQHGILRVLDYTMTSSSGTKAVFRKEYVANSMLQNPKYPKKSTEEWVFWPYDFQFSKTFTLTDQRLLINFEVEGEKDMPYMLGFHPAFMINKDTALLKTTEKTLSVAAVLEAGSFALPLENCTGLILTNNGAIEITISTKGFGHMMLWTEVTTMVCIEPVTFYPCLVPQQELHTGFRKIADNTNSYEVIIEPFSVI